MAISFGDNVKVLSSEQTDELGLSGKIGEVLAETSPSSTGVSFFGDAKYDYVINVAFEEPDVEYWFTPDLLEIVAQEEKKEIDNSNNQSTDSNKKWWQVWK